MQSAIRNNLVFLQQKIKYVNEICTIMEQVTVSMWLGDYYNLRIKICVHSSTKNYIF